MVEPFWWEGQRDATLSMAVIESYFSSKFYGHDIQVEMYMLFLFSLNVTVASPGPLSRQACV